MSEKKRVIIIGGGPAGLACGYWLTKNNQTNIIVLEATNEIGGISRTVNYKGFRFDLGPHRFFTKINEVENTVKELMGKDLIEVKRSTPIFFRGNYFDYPIKIGNVLKNLGPLVSLRVVFDYVWIKASGLMIKRPDNTYEQWITNRFGSSLYQFFFKSYTEKLWGIPCDKIGAEFAAQRIKGLSFFSAVKNAIVPQQGKIKTLIDKFQYPYYGTGQIYQRMVEEILRKNEVKTESQVFRVNHQGNKIISVDVRNNGKIINYPLDNLISSMAITDLVKTLNPKPSKEVIDAASKLTYRGLICVAIIINKPRVNPYTWVYVHEPKATIGRLHEPKNLSRRMVPDPKKTLLVTEIWTFESEKLWNAPDKKLIEIAINDLSSLMHFIKPKDVIDAVVVRVPKAYPTYKQGYQQHLAKIKNYLKQFKNLQLIGRYGTFRYNNMDHSILTGIYAAKNLIAGQYKFDIEDINKDEEYHEEKKQ